MIQNYHRKISDITVESGLQTGPFGSQLKAEEYVPLEGDAVPVVMPTNIDADAAKIVSQDIACASSEKAESLSKHRLKKGDLVFPRRGDLNKVAVAGEENEGWLCGTGCLRARLNPELVNYNYLAYFVQQNSVGQWLINNAVGQTMLNLNTEIVGNLPLYLPSRFEQDAIVEILSDCDTALSHQQKMINYHEQLLSALTNREMANPSNSRTVKLGEILSESRKPSTASDPSKRLSVRLHLNGVEKRVHRGTEAENSTLFFERSAGQLIYGKQNIFNGAIGLIPDELDGYASTQDIPAFDICEDVNKKWLLSFLSRPNFFRQLEKYASGSGSKRLHPEELFKIKVKLPNFDEQSKSSGRIEDARFALEEAKRLGDLLAKQKRGLMQQLLTGKLRVKGAA